MFHFSISPSNEYSRLISFQIDWFDLLAVQGTLKSNLIITTLKLLLSNTTVQKIDSLALRLSYDQHSHPCVTTGNNIALTIQTFIEK